MAIIEAQGLSRVYRNVVKEPGLKGAFTALFRTKVREVAAVDGVDFTMEAGESLACIGENGAGKSTLIKMMVGILSPTGGSVRVWGQDPMCHHRQYLRRIGVIFGQKTNLWWDIPVLESYRAVQVLYGVDKAAFNRTMDEVVTLLDLEPILSSPARKLSLGQRMKADMGMVFLHRPEILFLDEPTIGLDINVKIAIRTFIRRMNQEQGTSILLTSHDLADIDQICDNALVLSKGKISYQGGIDQLKARYAARKVVTVTGKPLGDIGAALPLAEVKVEGRKTSISFTAADYSSGELLQALSSCYELEDLTIQEPGIDYVVSQLFAQGAGK